jgi:hypothetical protein
MPVKPMENIAGFHRLPFRSGVLSFSGMIWYRHHINFNIKAGDWHAVASSNKRTGILLFFRPMAEN